MIFRETVPAKVVRIAFLAVWLVVSLFPLYWITVTSFKAPGDIFAQPLTYWPRAATLENYVGLFAQSDFGVYVWNSLLVSTVAALTATVISIFSGYVLARFQFRGKGVLLAAFFVTQMVPAFIALGPLYLMMTRLELVDTRLGLVLVYIGICIPFCTVMLRGFFANVPDALEEAAMIDGCSRTGALFRVIVPVMMPGIVASFIFNFVNCWNELFLSVTLMNSDENLTLPTAINGFISSFNVEWGPMAAAAVLTVVPTMLLFAFASRWIVQGLTAGAVKG
ncbi:carbohydrate ABC transporter permease [Kineococcus sp. DHX-1]|uniref:carbohydrate ABC transporter permease n=1 Tax=Kineococcus sp. DHX-1 TaxID=3349638 RepID=UPI0036D22695